MFVRIFPLRGRWAVYWSVVLLAVLIAACSDNENTPIPTPPAPPHPADDPTEYPLTLTDDNDVTVTIDAEPKRVVSILTSVTDLLLDLDVVDRIAGADDFSIQEPALADVPSIGGSNFTFNIETIADLEPDLVIAALGGTEQVVEQARALGIPTIVLDLRSNIAGVLERMMLLGQILNVPDIAADVVSTIEEGIAEIRQRAEGQPTVRVYIEIDQSTPTQPFTVGPGSVHNEILTIAGGENIFHDAASPFPQVNWEAILDRDPEVIFLLDSLEFADELAFAPISVEKISQRTSWEEISAVDDGYIVPLSPDLFGVGSRVLEALEQVADILDQVRSQTRTIPLTTAATNVKAA